MISIQWKELICAIALGTVCISVSGQSLSPDLLPVAWVGRLCSSETPANNKVMLAPHELSNHPSPERVCVDRTRPRLDYQANSLRVISYSWGGAAIKFNCESEDEASTFFQFFQDHERAQAALVIGNKVLGVYGVARPTMGCGWHQAADTAVAEKQCDAVAHAWGILTEGCTRSCGLGGGKGGICTIAK